MKELLTSWLNSVGLAYWVKIDTQSPKCTYYFGPFQSQSSAEAAEPGYVEDLNGENAQNIRTVIQRCKPTELTIADESDTLANPSVMQMVSSRI